MDTDDEVDEAGCHLQILVALNDPDLMLLHWSYLHVDMDWIEIDTLRVDLLDLCLSVGSFCGERVPSLVVQAVAVALQRNFAVCVG